MTFQARMQLVFFFFFLGGIFGSLEAQKVFTFSKLDIPASANKEVEKRLPTSQFDVVDVNPKQLKNYLDGQGDRAELTLKLPQHELPLVLEKKKVLTDSYVFSVNSVPAEHSFLKGKYSFFVGHIQPYTHKKVFFLIMDDYIRLIYDYQGEERELKSFKEQGLTIDFLKEKSTATHEEYDRSIAPQSAPSGSGESAADCIVGALDCATDPVVPFDGVVRILEIAIEADYEFYDEVHGQSLIDAEADIAMKVGAISAAYSAFFDMPVDISYCNVWTDINDPYSNSITPLTVYTEFEDYWDNNMACVRRDIAHRFVGRNLTACGFTRDISVQSICLFDNKFGRTKRHDYSWSKQPTFNFYKTAAHEIGHILGEDDETGGDCAAECGNAQDANLMCQRCSDVDNDVFTRSTQCKIWNNIKDLQCLQENTPQPTCENCFITAQLNRDNAQPVENCGPKSVVNYTLTVCNSCTAGMMDLAVRFPVDKLEYLPPSAFSYDGQGEISLTESFEIEECKSFNFTLRLKENINLPPILRVRIDGEEIFTQQLPLILFTPVGSAGTPTAVSGLISPPLVFSPISCTGVPTQASFRHYEIDGELVVDVEEYCFNNYVIKMLPGSKITVKNGSQLTIKNNSRLFACNEMWEGIIVEDGASLVVEESTIEDANIAIHAQDGASVSITNSTFIRNFMGVYSGPSVTMLNFGECFNNQFLGGTLLPQYNGQTAPTGMPTIGTEAFAGLWIQHQSQPIVSMDNEFIDLANGIFTYNTSLSSRSDYFRNILRGTYPENQAGFGIRALSGGTSQAHTLKVEGDGNTENPNFSTCTKAVLADGMNVAYIQRNVIRADVGICLLSCFPKAIVQDNRIVVQQRGVELGPINPASQIVVFNNQIEVEAVRGIGIQYNALASAPFSSNSKLISQNRIALMSPISIGIQTNGGWKLLIQSNDIDAPYGINFYQGIQVNHDYKSFLKCNSVTSSGNYWAGNYGINVYDGELTRYLCNTVSGMSTGVRLSMGSHCTERFQETKFSGNDVGLYVSATASPGVQTHQGNLWNGNFGSYGAGYGSNAPTDWEGSKFIIHTSNTPYFPVLSGNITPGFWFEIDGTGSPKQACQEITTCQIKLPLEEFEGDSDISSFDLDVADGTFSTTKNNTEMIRLAKRYLYRKLSEYPHLISPGSSFENFYNTERQSVVGAYYDIENAMAQLYFIDNRDMGPLEANFASIEANLEAIQRIDSLKAASQQGNPSQRQALLQDIVLLESHNTAILQNLLVQRHQDAAALAMQNDGVITGALTDENLRTVNAIFLNTVARGILQFSASQLADLQTIANQCPLSGGSAVFKARSLLALNGDYYYDNDAFCSDAGGRDMAPATTKKRLGHLQLFPNPATDEVTIALPELAGDSRLLLFDAFGKELMDTPIPYKENEWALSTESLAEGIYFIALYQNNQTTHIEKLVILR
ncbi:MAG: T9SS type A sorting domain-containing protein [Bacteroidota bacterium]